VASASRYIVAPPQFTAGVPSMTLLDFVGSQWRSRLQANDGVQEPLPRLYYEVLELPTTEAVDARRFEFKWLGCPRGVLDSYAAASDALPSGAPGAWVEEVMCVSWRARRMYLWCVGAARFCPGLRSICVHSLPALRVHSPHAGWLAD
jgi:hypothetical protein